MFLSMASATWDKHHNVGPRTSGSATELWSDNDPATTVKGCGFKNAEVAALTIQLAEQPGSRYKTYWTIRAMRERAARHPHTTEDMRAAVDVFDSWLAKWSEHGQRFDPNVSSEEVAE